MTPELISSLFRNLIRSIERVVAVAVNVLKDRLFSVRVINLPKTQAVKGTVTVANQKKLEKEVREINITLQKIYRILEREDVIIGKVTKDSYDKKLQEETSH